MSSTKLTWVINNLRRNPNKRKRGLNKGKNNLQGSKNLNTCKSLKSKDSKKNKSVTNRRRMITTEVTDDNMNILLNTR